MERLADYTRDQLARQRSRDFIKYVSCLVASNGAPLTALAIYQERFPRSVSIDLVRKAAVAPGTIGDPAWASPLVNLKPLTDAFLALSRPASLVGRIPNLRTVPFNCKIPVQTGGGTYGWVGEAKPKPLSALAFQTASLGFAKVAGIIVLTEELAQLSTPSAEAVVEADMAAGVAAFIDSQFINPAGAGVAGVNPPSITNGVVPIAPTGTTGAALVTDVKALIKAFRIAHGSTANLVLLMNPDDAYTLNAALGTPDANVAANGFTGIPVVVSASVGAQIVALDPTSILLADDGDVDISYSRDTMLQMDSVPMSPADATTVYVSMFATNSVALRVDRACVWAKGRATAVATVAPTAYV
jgi:hypothetical protein